MLTRRTIKLEKELASRARERARQQGYASLEEYIAHLIERDLAASTSNEIEKQSIVNKLKGLGYLE